jgi:hypothetical protein
MIAATVSGGSPDGKFCIQYVALFMVRRGKVRGGCFAAFFSYYRDRRTAMRIFLSVLIVAALAGTAAAQTPTAAPAGSNMPPDFYPHPQCEKPQGRLVAPGNDPDAMRIYNLKAFNDRATSFNVCLKAFIDNAQNDINTIQAIAHAAVTDANTH